MNPTHSPEQSGAGLSAGAHADLLKLPAVRHRGHHLGQFLLLTLQHSVDVLRRHLLGEEPHRFNGGAQLSWQTELLARYRRFRSSSGRSTASIGPVREINIAAAEAPILFLDLRTILNLRQTLAESLLKYSKAQGTQEDSEPT